MCKIFTKITDLIVVTIFVMSKCFLVFGRWYIDWVES